METNQNKSALTRRQFLGRTSLAVGSAGFAFPYVGKVLGANGTINVACIGVGGKGDSDSRAAGQAGGNIVAICDVAASALARKAEQFPKAKQFQDYRKMFDEIGDEIDAVTISTPDHNHGVAGIRAMKMGKHCFCQKPLTQTVSEARIMRNLSKEKKLATQMGNQGSAAPGLRRAVEVIQAGVIGDPKELHVWSNRPVWPQGLERPTGEDPVPKGLDWDAWIGPAAYRPYKKGVYHTFAWRGWKDFGTGALGDMACHTVNMPFRALKLGYPSAIECEIASRMFPETYPLTTRLRFDFPEREGLPPLKFWWYDGTPGAALTPLRPNSDLTREIYTVPTRGRRRGGNRGGGRMPISGALIVGEKGKLFSPDDYGTQFYVVMNDEATYVSGDEHEACKAVPQSIPRSPGHVEEWFRMMKDGTPSYSNFDIAAYLAEVILLGCVAINVGEGRRIGWDGPNMKPTDVAEAERYVTRHNRAGWEA